jgi:signal transduction histidine kinase
MSALPSAQTAGVREWAAAFADSSHSVQFYDSDDYLCRLVAEFVAEGLRAGEPAVIIATEAHRQGFIARLRAAGIEPDAVPLTMLDARATLRAFMDGAIPDENRFRSVIGHVLEQRCGGNPRTRIRAYGEMVDLLWTDGNPEAAVRVEELWNDLAELHSFTLLCAYPMGRFYKESHGRLFEEVCRTHACIAPSETFDTVGDDARAREMALLRQRAGALEAEIEHRKELESALRDSLRAKDEFLATLSHELRTPLTAILGWSRILDLGELDADTTRAAIRTIERSARAQAALIDDLLDVSRIVTGKLSMRAELVDLADVAERAAETLQLAAQSRDIAVELHATRGRAVVTGDANRLQQVAWNLISNAVKFSDNGARVSIAVERDDTNAYLTVRDCGTGIDAEFLPHAFEAFRQGDGSSTRATGGLGLGLAIVKHVAELHGGTVTATSDGAGHGATFTVTLPLA